MPGGLEKRRFDGVCACALPAAPAAAAKVTAAATTSRRDANGSPRMPDWISDVMAFPPWLQIDFVKHFTRFTRIFLLRSERRIAQTKLKGIRAFWAHCVQEGGERWSTSTSINSSLAA